MAEYIERNAVLRDWPLCDEPADAYQFIRDFPAADVRPVMHGKWKQTGGKYSRHKTIDRRILACSVCGNFLCMEGVNAGRGDANFCPNCGADMREES